MVATQPGNRWRGDDPQEAGLQSVILSRLLRAGAVRGVDVIAALHLLVTVDEIAALHHHLEHPPTV